MVEAPVGESSPASVKGDKNFNRLWYGLATSQLGSAIGMVALPIVAVSILGASTFEVAILSGASAVTVALLAFPMGSVVEVRRKRPVMITADLVRFVALASVPLAGYLGLLSFVQLCLVAVANAVGQIGFQAASQAHLKNLVSREALVDANGRLESTQWLSLTVGPSLGGALVGVAGAFLGFLVNSVAFVVSAVSVRRIPKPEPSPRGNLSGQDRRAALTGGLRFVRSHAQLRFMLLSWLGFAAGVGMLSPVTITFLLNDLSFSPFEYGLILGLPSIGGFLGARLARRASKTSGIRRTVVFSSLLRAPWQFLIPLASPGMPGLVLCLVGTFGVLFFSGLCNSSMAAFRAMETPDGLMSRVSTLWSFTTTVGQPLFILLGGVIGTTIGARSGIVIAACVMLGSSFITLPVLRTPQTPTASTEGTEPA